MPSVKSEYFLRDVKYQKKLSPINPSKLEKFKLGLFPPVFLLYSHTTTTLTLLTPEMWLFPTPPSNSPTGAQHFTIQLNSDTIHREIAADPTG